MAASASGALASAFGLRGFRPTAKRRASSRSTKLLSTIFIKPESSARTWYLNAATAMNPSMAYAQSAGPCGTGNPTGIIEASSVVMTDALDGLAILALDTRANGWTATDQAGMRRG